MGRLKGKLASEDDGKKLKKDAPVGKGRPSSPAMSSSTSTSTLPVSKANGQGRSVSSPSAPPASGPLTPSYSQPGAENVKTTDGSKTKGRSMFNMKNASTDNISIASAASSASMMIRKIGNFGKLAKRNRFVSCDRDLDLLANLEAAC